MSKIILDLCGGTGSWGKPYREAGYDVRLVTLPDQDVRMYEPPEGVHGILAAPPCTEFARCGARWWHVKPPEKLEEALSVVEACQRIIDQAKPKWWAIENPIGRLNRFLGEPTFKFDPWEFGDPWTKRTWLWGQFNQPVPVFGAQRPSNSFPGHWSNQHWRTKFQEEQMLKAMPYLAGLESAAIRAATPPGFARAFFEANP